MVKSIDNIDADTKGNLGHLDTYRRATDRLDRAVNKKFKGKMVRVIKKPKLFSWEGHIKCDEIIGRMVEISYFSSTHGHNIFHGHIMRKDLTDTLHTGRIALSYDEFQFLEDF